MDTLSFSPIPSVIFIWFWHTADVKSQLISSNISFSFFLYIFFLKETRCNFDHCWAFLCYEIKTAVENKRQTSKTRRSKICTAVVVPRKKKGERQGGLGESLCLNSRSSPRSVDLSLLTYDSAELPRFVLSKQPEITHQSVQAYLNKNVFTSRGQVVVSLLPIIGRLDEEEEYLFFFVEEEKMKKLL